MKLKFIPLILLNTITWYSLISSFPLKGLSQTQVPTITVWQDSVEGQQVKIPDLSRITFATLPRITTSGELPGTNRRWVAGQTPDQFLRLSDISEALGAEGFTLGEIAAFVSLDLENIALSSFPLAGQQTLQQLARSVPYLADYSWVDVAPLADLFQRIGLPLSGALDFDNSQMARRLSQLLNIEVSSEAIASLSETLGGQSLVEISVGELLDLLPQLRDVSLEAIADLNRFSIDSIPNLDATQLSTLSGWQEQEIASIPGLSQVPLMQFPNPLAGLTGTQLLNVMRLDFIYGPAETNRTRTISGSDVEGFNVDCNTNCAHLELDDLENIGRPARSPSEGWQWISGKYQQVEGGHGCLKFVNGGKEPTGRLPYGKAFKVVVMEPDETTDTVDFAMYLRFCNHCGCTPYFIGPIPFMTHRVNDWIYVGKL